MTALIIAIVILGLVGIVVVVMNVVMRRRGYDIPGTTVVRCSKGHLFTTTWVEGGSLKAVRLGPTKRYQRCPACRRWAIVRPLRDEDLTDDERRAAAHGGTGPGGGDGMRSPTHD